MRLSIEHLEDRSVPSATTLEAIGTPIPGFTGPVSAAVGMYTEEFGFQTAFIPEVLSGGSARLVVREGVNDPNGAILMDKILYDPNFRGGASIAEYGVPGRVAGQAVVTNSIVVTPGPGGGPIVTIVSLNSDSGALDVMSQQYVQPYAETFRGGLIMQQVEMSIGGRLDIGFLPGEGGSAQFVCLNVTDPANPVVDISSFVGGDPNYRRGPDSGPANINFTPDGGGVNSQHGTWDEVFGVGPTVLDPVSGHLRVTSSLAVNLTTGADDTALWAPIPV